MKVVKHHIFNCRLVTIYKLICAKHCFFFQKSSTRNQAPRFCSISVFISLISLEKKFKHAFSFKGRWKQRHSTFLFKKRIALGMHARKQIFWNILLSCFFENTKKSFFFSYSASFFSFFFYIYFSKIFFWNIPYHRTKRILCLKKTHNYSKRERYQRALILEESPL